MPVVAGALGAIGSIYGAKKQGDLQEQAVANAQMRPLAFELGGTFARDNRVNLSRDLSSLQDLFGSGAQGILSGIDFTSGIPGDVLQANRAFDQFLTPNVDSGLGGLDALFGRSTGLLDRAFSGGQVPSFGALDPTQGFLSGGEGLRAFLSGSYDEEGTRQQTLDALRAQALPEQQRAVSSTLDRLFGTGNLGTTGGANILGRLSEAQNQQDLGFQLAAGQEARAGRAALTSDVTSRFQSLLAGDQARGQLGLQGGIATRDFALRGRQLEDSILSSAFGRFGDTARLAADLNQTGFSRRAALEERGYGRISDQFSRILGLQTLPTTLQSGRLGLSQQLLSGYGGVQNLGLDVFRAALEKERVRTGASGSVLSSVTSPSFSASPLADAFSSLAAGYASRPRTPVSSAPTTVFNPSTIDPLASIR